MVLVVEGSNSTWFTPRNEPKLERNAPPGRSALLQTGTGSPISVKVAPPSVDFQIPTGGKLGFCENSPPDGTPSPRTPRADPTYRVFPLTTIELIERPSNAGPLYGPMTGVAPQPIAAATVVLAARCVQLLPPSVDL